MQRLSPSVTYYEPSEKQLAASEGTTRSDPELVLILTWMGAREEHINKYAESYRALFPRSRILIAQCPLAHVVYPWLSFTQIRPAIPIIKQFLPEKPGDETRGRPRVLLHAFSNGGVSTTIQIYTKLKKQLGGKLVLPRHAFIFDSCPGTFHWRRTALAITLTAPKWTSPIVHAVLALIYVIYKLPFLESPQNRNAKAIRNPQHRASETSRTYLYTTNDKLIPPAEVEEQARLAKDAGFNVRLERFVGPDHCAIAKAEPDRYWKAVRETWETPAVQDEKVQ